MSKTKKQQTGRLSRRPSLAPGSDRHCLIIRFQFRPGQPNKVVIEGMDLDEDQFMPWTRVFSATAAKAVELIEAMIPNTSARVDPNTEVSSGAKTP